MFTELIKDYKWSLANVRKKQKQCSEKDFTVLSGVASDLEYAIEWMQTGRRPGNKRGIERRAAYQRERPFDPLVMQRYFRSTEEIYEWDDHQKEDVVSITDKERIEDALSILTEREKEIYLMSRGYNIPYSNIAYFLDISVSTVKTNITRAETKIAQQIHSSLFCLYG